VIILATLGATRAYRHDLYHRELSTANTDAIVQLITPESTPAPRFSHRRDGHL
jgi:hypothetical protein